MKPIEVQGPSIRQSHARPIFVWLASTILVAAVPALVSAEPVRDGFTVIVPAPTVVIEQRVDRRTELRQALTSGVDLPQVRSEGQRISRDQSEALNRELREALRGVYENRGGIDR